MKKTKNDVKKSSSSSKVTKSSKSTKKPEETMDRPTLIGIARLLKGAGSDVKAFKSDSDEALQKKVNDAIHRLPTPEVIKQLEAIDPNKLVNVLKRDCIGIFVDFSDVACVRCPDAKACVTAFVGNLKGGFARLGEIASDKPAAAPATSKPGVVPVTRFEADRRVFIRDVENPNPEGDDYHDTIQRVLDEQPENMAELRAIVEQDFDFDGDGDFMKFVTALRDPKEGVVKLDVDLSDKDKVTLRKAGYDV